LKPQYVDSLPQSNRGEFGEKKVMDVINSTDERNLKEYLMKSLELNHLKDRQIKVLSGGELQRLAIALTIMKNVDV